MRVLVLSGIYPPDIGGPATHARDLAKELRSRGHDVTVLTLWAADFTKETPELVRLPRQRSALLRIAHIVWWLMRNRRRFDVVYATGLHSEAVLGGVLARRPVVVKIVGDPAWERAVRRGLTTLSVDEFQTAGSGPVVRALRLVRNWTVQHASAVTVPSKYLRNMVSSWLTDDRYIFVIPNGVRVTYPPRTQKSNGDRLRLLFAGRLVAHKRVDILIDAIAACNGRATLTLVGDGPELGRLRSQVRSYPEDTRSCITFAGALPQEDVLRKLGETDALVLASEYEGLPHAVIESLAMGTPVVSPDVGGVREAIRDGLNGVLVSKVSSDAFSNAFRRLEGDRHLLRRLSEGASRNASSWSFERTATQLERLLLSEFKRKPTCVFIGKTPIPASPGPDLERKFAILSENFKASVIATGTPGFKSIAGARILRFPRARPALLGGILFYFLGPFLALLVAGPHRSSVVVCQSPFEAFGLVLVTRVVPRSLRPRIVVEAHGDWRTAPRMYGLRGRRLLAPFSDALASWTVQRADRVRVVGIYLEEMVRETGYDGPMDRFVTFSDFQAFLDEPLRPLPDDIKPVFIGVFQRYKAVDVLIEAWAEACPKLNSATLTLAGDGPLRDEIRRRAAQLGVSDRVEFLGAVPRTEVISLLDASSCLLLPSRSEGLPRIILEAMARQRAVIASRVGDIPEILHDGVNGVLVNPGDQADLAQAIVRLLSDHEALAQMGKRGREMAVERNPVGEYKAGMARLANWARSI